MTNNEAAKFAGRSISWLRTHECAWCDQVLLKALTRGCVATGEKCDPLKKNFTKSALPSARAQSEKR